MENLLQLLHLRRSIRKYKESPLEADIVRELLEAPLLAPSSKRSTPWEFILVQDPEIREKLGQSRAANSAFAAKAPLIAVIVADTQKTDVWVEDASIAAAYLQLKVEEMGLGSCWVQLRLRQTADGTSCEAYVRGLLGLPEQYGVLCMIAIGEKGEIKKPFDDSRLQWNKLHAETFQPEQLPVKE